MPEEMFTTVRRGYDPGEVERAVGQAQAEVADLRRRLEAAEAAAETAKGEASASREALVARESQQPEAPSYEHLGERIGQMLSLAEAEAAEVRDRVLGEVETMRKEAEQEGWAPARCAPRTPPRRRRGPFPRRRRHDGERDAAERDASHARVAEAACTTPRQGRPGGRGLRDQAGSVASARRPRPSCRPSRPTQAELDAMAARRSRTPRPPSSATGRRPRSASPGCSTHADAEEESTPWCPRPAPPPTGCGPSPSELRCRRPAPRRRRVLQHPRCSPPSPAPCPHHRPVRRARRPATAPTPPATRRRRRRSRRVSATGRPPRRGIRTTPAAPGAGASTMSHPSACQCGCPPPGLAPLIRARGGTPTVPAAQMQAGAPLGRRTRRDARATLGRPSPERADPCSSARAGRRGGRLLRLVGLVGLLGDDPSDHAAAVITAWARAILSGA